MLKCIALLNVVFLFRIIILKGTLNEFGIIIEKGKCTVNSCKRLRLKSL